MLKYTFGVVAMVFALSTATQAAPISMRTKVSCLPDYYRFCNGWPQEELRRCFQMNVLRVHNVCIDSFIDEGLVTKAEVDGMKTQALAMLNTKPIVKSTMPPPINPNPTLEEIRNKSKPPEKGVSKKEVIKAKVVQPSVPAKGKSNPEFERWKRQNGFI